MVGNVRGNVVGVFDSDGHLQARYEYDMWGNHRVLDAEGNVTTDPSHIGNVNAWRWQSQYYDVESGLYYAGGRYYDPRVGVVINAGADNADMSGGYAYDEVNPYEVFPASILTKSWWSPQEYAPSWVDVRRSSNRWNWWQWAMVVGGMAALIVLTKGAGKMLLLKFKQGKAKAITPEALARKFTHNPKSSQVMIGKHDFGNATGYVTRAKQLKNTYFAMPPKTWNKLEIVYRDRGGMWQINEAFLNQQIAAGKSFMSSHSVIHSTGFFAQELNHLLELRIPIGNIFLL